MRYNRSDTCMHPVRMDMLFSTPVRPYATVHLLDQKLYLHKGQDVSGFLVNIVSDCERFGWIEVRFCIYFYNTSIQKHYMFFVPKSSATHKSWNSKVHSSLLVIFVSVSSAMDHELWLRPTNPQQQLDPNPVPCLQMSGRSWEQYL